jgi:hypothetical protein
MTSLPCASLRPALALAAIAVTGCAQFTVRSDRAPDADFARYRTFAWMRHAEAPPGDQDTGSRGLDNRIYSAVETELQRKGYAPAEHDAADLLATFRILQRDGYEEAHVAYGTQWYRGAYLDAMHASPDSFVRGTLIIDLVDRTGKTLVWRGAASARLLPHTSYEATVERAQAAVTKTFETFPAR